MGLTMDLKESLRHRQWPTRPERMRHFRLPYVREGRIFNRALQRHQDISEPIPPGECAITSLVAARSGAIFGATSGRRSHLFCYRPDPEKDCVFDLGVIEEARAIRHTLVTGKDRKLFAGVSEATEGCTEGGLFQYSRRKIEKLTVPVPGECIVGLAIDNSRDRLYGLSSQSGSFFSYDIGTGKASIKGTVADNGDYSHLLVADRTGSIYGAGPFGQLFRFDPTADKLDYTSIYLPSVAGREFYNRLDAAALDPTTGLIYGGGSADGVIFVFDPQKQVIRSLGKVTAEPRCRAITVGLDGRVYGIAGEPDGMGHLFCYDPQLHELRDLGIPYATSERVWHGYEFEAACTGACGEIYLGESDRISHLFIYFPPIRPRHHSQTENAP